MNHHHQHFQHVQKLRIVAIRHCRRCLCLLPGILDLPTFRLYWVIRYTCVGGCNAGSNRYVVSVGKWGEAIRDLRFRDEEEEGSPKQTCLSSLTSPGTCETSRAMSWTSLPDDVVHVILAKVCLIELARITTTCSSFRDVYRKRMTREQEARRQLAVNTLGAPRIACMLDLIWHLLKWEPLPPGFGNNELNWFWICPDGVLHDPLWLAYPHMFVNGNIRTHLLRMEYLGLRALNVELHCGGGSMRVAIYRHWADIEITLLNDEDFVPVALVQVMLTEGLSRIIHDAGLHLRIIIQRSYIATQFTQQGLRAQIAPLLPFASQYTPEETTVGTPVCEHMRIG